MEYENDHKELNFMDVTIRNNLNQYDDFTVCLKPHSNICRNIAMGDFKGFLLHALHICLENYLAQDIEFLTKFLTKKHLENLTSVKEKVNIETIQNDQIVKLPWVPKPGLGS